MWKDAVGVEVCVMLWKGGWWKGAVEVKVCVMLWELEGCGKVLWKGRFGWKEEDKEKIHR